MGKLFNLKQWLTVADTARHLSIVFGEDVTEADVLRLALDSQLKLSVYFVNGALAKYAKVVPLVGAKLDRLWPPLIPPEVLKYHPDFLDFPKGAPLYFRDRWFKLNEDDGLELDANVVTIDGVWDLPMIGNERRYIEDEYQELTGGPAATFLCVEGVFVQARDGKLCQLQSRDGAFKLPKSNPHWGNDPSCGLPTDSVLVVRTDALREFEKSINKAPTSGEKAMATTERNTLLTIIAALCDYSAIKHQERGAAKQIAMLTEEIGATVTDDTVRKALAKIPDALSSRMK